MNMPERSESPENSDHQHDVEVTLLCSNIQKARELAMMMGSNEVAIINNSVSFFSMVELEKRVNGARLFLVYPDGQMAALCASTDPEPENFHPGFRRVLTAVAGMLFSQVTKLRRRG